MQVAGSEDAAPAPDPVGAPPVDDLERVALPEIRTSYRAKRRAQRQRARLRRRLAIGGAVTAIAVAAAAVVVIGSNDDRPTLSEDDGGAGPATAATARPLLLAQTGPDGRAVSVTVLVPGPAGAGGTVLLVPPGTMTEVAGLGPQPVGRTLQLGGIERLRTTTQNLLGATVDDAVALDGAELAAVARLAGSLRVTLDERVERVDDSGLVTVLFEKGTFDLQPDDVADFLGEQGRGTDLARLARHQSYWEAWLAALRADPDAIPAEPAALRRTLGALAAAGDTLIRLLPVEAFGSTAEDGELYTPQTDELVDLVGAVFAGRGQAGPRARVRVLNGTGELELARKVTEQLAPADVQVTLTGNAEPFGYETTEIIYYDPANRAVAERIRDALGVGKLVRNRNETGVVDVTIIVGKDFRAE